MEELQRIAKIYYDAAPDNTKQMAVDFFNEMDHDKDGKIVFKEFLVFMNEKGALQMCNYNFFKLLDDGSGTLDFWKVLTLFYIIESGRKFCAGCRNFVPGLYFTCVKCFDDARDTFDVCSSCFYLREYDHHHNHFMDNFALLQTKRITALTQKQTRIAANNTKASTSKPSEFTRANYTTHNFAQVNPRRSTVEDAAKVIGAAVDVGKLALNVATNSANVANAFGCSIM